MIKEPPETRDAGAFRTHLYNNSENNGIKAENMRKYAAYLPQQLIELTFYRQPECRIWINKTKTKNKRPTSNYYVKLATEKFALRFTSYKSDIFKGNP